MSLPNTKTELKSQALKEIDTANQLQEQYSGGLLQCLYLQNKHELAFLDQQIKLIRQLLDNVSTQKQTAQAVLNILSDNLVKV